MRSAPRRPQSLSMGQLTASEWPIALLLAVPAVIVPGALDRFVFGKLVVAAVAIVFAFSVRTSGRLSRQATALLCAGTGVVLISALASDSPRVALLGRQPLSEGVLVLGVYLLTGASGARLLGPDRQPRALRVAFGVMALCSVLVGFVGFLEACGLRPLSSDLSRPGSLLGSASDQGALAVLYLGPLLRRSLATRAPLPIAGAAAAVVSIVLSGSRGALVGLLVVLVVVAVLSGRRARWAVSATALAAALLAMAVPLTRHRVLGSSPLAGHTVSGRNLLWRESLRLFAHNPLLGVGPNQFEVAIAGEHDRQWQHTVGPVNPPGTPHNWILQALTVGGVPLLLVLLGLGGLVVRSAVRRIRAGDEVWSGGVLAGFLGYAAALLFHFPTPGTAVPACLMLGGLLGRSGSDVRATSRSPWTVGAQRLARPAAIVTGCVLAVVFLLAAIAEIYLRLGAQAVDRHDYASGDHDYGVARTLRFWDVDVPGQALAAFAVPTSSGDAAAVPYARRWAARTGPVSDDEQIVQNRAAVLVAEQDYAAAGRELDPVLRNDPYNPRLLVLRGVAYVGLHQNAQAEATLRLAAAVDTSDPAPWHDLAVLYRSEGRNAEASAAETKYSELSRTK